MENRESKVIIKISCGTELNVEYIPFEDSATFSDIVKEHLCQDAFNYVAIKLQIPPADGTYSVICADYFKALPNELQDLNLSGTAVYGRDTPIMGNILIFADKYDEDGSLTYDGISHLEYMDEEELDAGWQLDIGNSWIVADYFMRLHNNIMSGDIKLFGGNEE